MAGAAGGRAARAEAGGGAGQVVLSQGCKEKRSKVNKQIDSWPVMFPVISCLDFNHTERMAHPLGPGPAF